MCSPDEGFFLKVYFNFLTICVIIFQHTGRIFIRYYAFCIYIHIYDVYMEGLISN